MSLTSNTALVASVFGIFGFFMAFSLKRAINIILFGVFAYASLKALDYLGVSTDWKLVEYLIHTISQFGRTVLDLMSALFRAATFTSIFCFLCGGLFGFILSK